MLHVWVACPLWTNTEGCPVLQRNPNGRGVPLVHYLKWQCQAVHYLCICYTLARPALHVLSVLWPAVSWLSQSAPEEPSAFKERVVRVVWDSHFDSFWPYPVSPALITQAVFRGANYIPKPDTVCRVGYCGNNLTLFYSASRRLLKKSVWN